MSSRVRRTMLSLALVGCLTIGLTTSAAAQSGMWSVLSVTGAKPSARKHHTMVYDPVNNRVLLFGGEDPAVKNDLWVLHLNGTPYWEPITPGGITMPALHGHNAVLDAANSRMLVFGGRTDDGVTEASFPNGVRALLWNAGYQWSLLFNYPTRKIKVCPATPPGCALAYPRRTHAAAASLGGAVYVMGGQKTPGMFSMNDLWTHDFGTTQWSWMSGSLFGGAGSVCDGCIDYSDFNIPTTRYYHSMIADGHGRLVVFGGIYDEIDVSNAYVSLGGGPWAYLGDAPTSPYNFGRKSHTSVFDPVRNRMVVVGGYFGSGGNETLVPTADVTSLPLPEGLPQFSTFGEVNDNWVLNPNCGPDPGPMAEHAAVYDSQGDRIIVFGGVGDGAGTLRNNDVWVLDLSDNAAPAASTLEPGQVGQISSTIHWTAPGDDGSTGTACRYDLRRSEQTITEENFSNAAQLPTDTPGIAGTIECATTGPNQACTVYYYALKTIDDGGNVSPMSNVLAIQQTCGGVSYACTGGGGGMMAATPVPASSLQFGIRSENPVRGPVRIGLSVPRAREGEALELTIHDVAGKRVRTLLNQAAAPGDFDLRWDLRDDAGAGVAPGIYFARLRIGAEAYARKVVFARGR